MKRTRNIWLRLAFTLLLTLAAAGLTFPRLVGLTRNASLEAISPGQGLLYEAPWPSSLRHPLKRTILPEEAPTLTENGRALVLRERKAYYHRAARRRKIPVYGKKGAVFQLRRHLAADQWTNLRRLHRKLARSRTTTSPVVGHRVARMAFLAPAIRENNRARHVSVHASTMESF